ncbi:aldo/keto reductase, partial [Providencia rettgeri]|nr:aldo/keto reductase [Providencia rettgeri]
MSTTPPTITFHDDNRAPQLGLGVWQVPAEQTADVVCSGIEAGYRLIDTAAIYGNEAEVGQGIRQSKVPREELFVTTKLWNDMHGHDNTRAGFEESMDKLQLDYVDLYLIHWPVPKNRQYIQTWETLINLRNEGRVKSIGVCNFLPQHLQTLLDKTGVLPVLNQIELHPGFQQAESRHYHEDQAIQTQAWSPLGLGTLWDNPVLNKIAKQHGRSVAQVMLRWQIQLGNMVITKSNSPERQRANMDIFSFELSEQD